MAKLRSAVAVAAIMGATVGLASSASASSLPTLLTNIKCTHQCSRFVGVYKVKPHTVVLSDAEGGNLQITWGSWTATSASGSGTAVVSNMGTTTTTDVMATAARVRKGTFTRLTVTAKLANGTTQSEHLHLVLSSGPTWSR